MFREGSDYVVMERVRFLDRMGFDQPVEAFSLLLPRGWQSDGGVTWKGVQTCRGEMVAMAMTSRSPDRAIQLDVLPPRSFQWTDDPMLLQTMQVGAQHGGCGVNTAFDALQYADGFARRDLGATATNIRADTARLPTSATFDEQANQIARQFGNATEQRTTIAYADLQWPDGTQGLLHTGVTNTFSRQPNMLTGGGTVMTTTNVFHTVVVRYPVARKVEALGVFETAMASHRINPVWRGAKETFLSQLSTVEHAGAMERIRLMGEQSRAYAKSASDASDRRLRDWENRQHNTAAGSGGSDDSQHRAFIQTIREVETWKDDSGGVELSAGYDQAWSRGDGSYILSNTAGFDPRAAFQDQTWTQMQRTKP